ncbi:4-alpha-glucanotransferase [Methylacidimicrobium cyclopophantes]|uniref:4-alpha-glucanotransferase n=1 Tax=Methylacidimicrobium cyclopophantes TaxID=1041766 RepID=A0A5E6MEF9_9BACT|nr:4-alpha-glucanotransferase [Methylacidimicrobium cyclopophantes]VVM07944.1 4-alpha-glucanotransferase [Methylacidimicrobium cyclopophantes]
MRIDLSERVVGLLTPVSALRRPGDLGIGDARAVREAIDFCAELGIRWLQLLPINETSGDNSPYNAISSLALEPALFALEPDEVPGLLAEDLPKGWVEEAAKEEAIDYPRVKERKRRLLERAFERFSAERPPSWGEFQAFCRAHASWLKGYSLFRALLDRQGGDPRWDLWPKEVSHYRNALAWLRTARPRELLRKRSFYAFVQWVGYRQWKAVRAYGVSRGVRLMGDIPFGISRYGSDVWTNPPLFDTSWCGGAPPERFFQSDAFIQKWGQNWGIPLYAWDRHEAEGFAWWKHRIARTLEIFHGFRIDHVLGFFRIYAFPWKPEENSVFLPLTPEQAQARTGGRLPRFLPASDEDLEAAARNAVRGVLLLHRLLEETGEAAVIAEDLGFVPFYVRPALSELGIPGFKIPMFERAEDHSYLPVSSYPRLSVATYATHDHPPLACFYRGLIERWSGPSGHDAWLELQRLMAFLGWNPETPPRDFSRDLHLRLLEVLLDSPSWMASVLISDLLGIETRFNQPGADRNWIARLSLPLEEYRRRPPFAELLSAFRALAIKSGRGRTG